MEESKALTKLAESIDLLGLLEEILNPASIERFSTSAWTGLRLSLKNAREIIQASHGTLSKEFVNRSKHFAASAINPITATPATNVQKADNEQTENASPISVHMSDAHKIQITRRDLKASLERFIER